MFYRIKQIQNKSEFKQYYQLRWQLLRAPWHQPQGSEIDDIEDQCFHTIAVDNKDKIIGIARLQFNSISEAQIRYMAVTKVHEKKGIGNKMVNFMENHATKTGRSTIVLDARENAVGFYEKLGYKISKKSYMLFNEIQHYSMIKTLTSCGIE